MPKVESCSFGSLEELESWSSDYIKGQTICQSRKSVEDSDIFLPWGYHAIKIMGVCLSFGVVPSDSIVVNPHSAKEIMEIDGVVAKEYKPLVNQKTAQKKTIMALEDTIDMEDILLEREVIAEYQSKMKSFIRKRHQKKIRF